MCISEVPPLSRYKDIDLSNRVWPLSPFRCFFPSGFPPPRLTERRSSCARASLLQTLDGLVFPRKSPLPIEIFFLFLEAATPLTAETERTSSRQRHDFVGDLNFEVEPGCFFTAEAYLSFPPFFPGGAAGFFYSPLTFPRNSREFRIR